MLLTIGMIVKNEEKYLRDCLNALQPILKNISSELIIVDTGSTDRTVEIAKEFTDKVLYFEWIKDFSAARNHGLAQAKGEWFMAVDADEIFMSCDDIIGFFKSGEYKNYNSAVFTMRNYSDPENKQYYTDFYVPRLTKILPETKYVNPVHEQLTTYGMPIRVLTDTAEHFGYAFSGDPELLKEKYRRNMSLLEERLETDEKETNPTLYKELIDTYCLQSDADVKEKSDAIIGFAQKGIEICRKQKKDYILCLYHTLMSFYIRLKRYEDAVKVYDEYFSVDKEIRGGIRNTDLDIIGYAAQSLYILDRNEEAYNMFRKFYELNDFIEKNKICTGDVLYLTQRTTGKAVLDIFNVQFTDCCINTGRYKEAENNFREYPDSTYAYDRQLYIKRIRQKMSVLSKYNVRDIAGIYGGSDEKLKKRFFDALRYNLINSDEADRCAVINKLSSLNLKNAAQRALIALYKAHFTGGAGAERTENFIQKHGADYPDVLYIMLDEGLDITPFVSVCSDTEKAIEVAYGCMDGFGGKLNGYSADNIKDVNGIHGAVKMYLAAVIDGAKKGLDIQNLLNTSGNLGIKHLQVFGEKNIPEEVYAAVTVAEINLLRGCRDFKSCIEAVRRLIKLNKRYAPVASAYQALIKAEI